jgi:hypothetical protein
MFCKGLPDEHDRAPRSVKRNQRCLDRCDAHLTSEMGQKANGRDIQVMSVPTPIVLQKSFCTLIKNSAGP